MSPESRAQTAPQRKAEESEKCAALAREPSEPVAWIYPRPRPRFERIRNFYAFYPGRVACYVDGERVEPQPGRFYGGWITSDVVGPFKGDPGTGHW